jgi:hypothetical protein
MPKKRRKSIVTINTPDLPYPKVRVEWVDCTSDSGWATNKEFDKMRVSDDQSMKVGCILKIKIQLSYLHLTTEKTMACFTCLVIVL